MDKLEGNKLIAEFMELHKTNLGTNQEFYLKVGKAFIDAKHLQYHKSWDWLMPVVEKICKIEDGRFSVDISSVGMWACFIKRDDNFENSIADFGGYEPIILNVYHSVVKFIKWYNKNKQ